MIELDRIALLRIWVASVATRVLEFRRGSAAVSSIRFPPKKSARERPPPMKQCRGGASVQQPLPERESNIKGIGHAML
jgi:hypothetical protein